MLTSHYGPKQKKKLHRIIYFPTSEGVNEVSKRANEWAQRSAQAKQVVRGKKMSERSERMSEQKSELPSTLVCVPGYSG